eukprot:CAMPEP_0179296018 /NCGR_PEP_ID=MMETSP0797-20121207/44721_1 /TAXON_ID=47934 /ORGANISM="Dinophysis acuminata, Strain DAEP01" /LENGTH=168 /DNA_ID=CAMNT_0021005281 /DNA_START=64 /DNA_END=567 /DNA_ORIENTATION=+
MRDGSLRRPASFIDGPPEKALHHLLRFGRRGECPAAGGLVSLQVLPAGAHPLEQPVDAGADASVVGADTVVVVGIGVNACFIERRLVHDLLGRKQLMQQVRELIPLQLVNLRDERLSILRHGEVQRLVGLDDRSELLRADEDIHSTASLTHCPSEMNSPASLLGAAPA